MNKRNTTRKGNTSDLLFYSTSADFVQGTFSSIRSRQRQKERDQTQLVGLSLRKKSKWEQELMTQESLMQ